MGTPAPSNLEKLRIRHSRERDECEDNLDPKAKRRPASSQVLDDVVASRDRIVLPKPEATLTPDPTQSSLPHETLQAAQLISRHGTSSRPHHSHDSTFTPNKAESTISTASSSSSGIIAPPTRSSVAKVTIRCNSISAVVSISKTPAMESDETDWRKFYTHLLGKDILDLDYIASTSHAQLSEQHKDQALNWARDRLLHSSILLSAITFQPISMAEKAITPRTSADLSHRMQIQSKEGASLKSHQYDYSMSAPTSFDAHQSQSTSTPARHVASTSVLTKSPFERSSARPASPRTLDAAHLISALGSPRIPTTPTFANSSTSAQSPGFPTRADDVSASFIPTVGRASPVSRVTTSSDLFSLLKPPPKAPTAPSSFVHEAFKSPGIITRQVKRLQQSLGDATEKPTTIFDFADGTKVHEPVDHHRPPNSGSLAPLSASFELLLQASTLSQELEQLQQRYKSERSSTVITSEPRVANTVPTTVSATTSTNEISHIKHSVPHQEYSSNKDLAIPVLIAWLGKSDVIVYKQTVHDMQAYLRSQTGLTFRLSDLQHWMTGQLLTRCLPGPSSSQPELGERLTSSHERIRSLYLKSDQLPGVIFLSALALDVLDFSAPPDANSETPSADHAHQRVRVCLISACCSTNGIVGVNIIEGIPSPVDYQLCLQRSVADSQYKVLVCDSLESEHVANMLTYAQEHGLEFLLAASQVGITPSQSLHRRFKCLLTAEHQNRISELNSTPSNAKGKCVLAISRSAWERLTPADVLSAISETRLSVIDA